jgi:hypothetical protein
MGWGASALVSICTTLAGQQIVIDDKNQQSAAAGAVSLLGVGVLEFGKHGVNRLELNRLAKRRKLHPARLHDRDEHTKRIARRLTAHATHVHSEPLRHSMSLL